MTQKTEGRYATFTAGAAMASDLRVKLTAGLLQLAGSTDHEIGTLLSRTFASGDPATVDLRTGEGTVPMIASEAITAGNPVYAASGGKVAASGTVLIGTALEAAANDGDGIEVLRRQETSDSAAAGGTTAAAFLVDSDAATPKAELAGDSAGTGDFKATFKAPATLTGNRVYRGPGDSDQTLVGETAQQVLSGKSIVTQKHTADDTLTAAEVGSRHSNAGASGTVTLGLPAAVVGMHFNFAVNAAQQLRLDPNGSETIALPSTNVQGAAGKYLVASAIVARLRLVCETAGQWDVDHYSGTWTAEP